MELKTLYKPIEASEKFDEETFGIHGNKLGGLEDTLKAIDKDSNDSNAIKKAGILTVDNADFYMTQSNPAMVAKFGVTNAINEGNPAFLGYTVAHSEDVYKMLSVKEKSELSSKAAYLGIEKTEVKDKEGKVDEKKTAANVEYNAFASLSNTAQFISKVDSEENTELRNRSKLEFVATHAQYSPKWFQAMTRQFAANDKYISSVFSEYATQVGNDLMDMTADKEGNTDLKKLEKFYDTNFNLHNSVKDENKSVSYFVELKDQGIVAYNRRVDEKAKK